MIFIRIIYIYTYFITYIQAYYSSHIYIYIDACCLPWVSLWLRLALLVQRSDSFDPAMAVFLSLRAWYSKRTGRLAAQFRREDSYLENILMCIGLCWFIFIHLIYVDLCWFIWLMLIYVDLCWCIVLFGEWGNGFWLHIKSASPFSTTASQLRSEFEVKFCSAIKTRALTIRPS